jgi:protein-S-isoprenylcysteine O-methyltransferase Ste14
MKTNLQAATLSVFGLLFFGLLLFWPAGTFNYWQAWVFIGVFAVLSAVYTVYLAVKNPDVLRRRMRSGLMAETRPVQKAVAASVYVTFTALLIVSALDHRFDWSRVPATVSLAGDLLVAIGFGISVLVVVQNNYTAATITVEAGQKVVSTGLYGLVRHPMYFGALIMIVGIPLAVESYWGLLVLIPIVMVFAFRILDEENALKQELAGYREYTQKVHHRLVPYVW